MKKKNGKRKTAGTRGGKRILVFCDFRGGLGDAMRVSRVTEFLASRGHDVELCNVFEHRSTPLRAVKNTRPVNTFLACLSGTGKIRDWAYRGLCEKVLSRRLNSAKNEKHEKRFFDAVLAEGIVQGANAVEPCSRFGVPLFTDVHGLASAEYEENPFNRVSRRRLDFLRAAEGRAVRESAGVSVVSTPMRDYFVELGASAHKLFVAFNGADAPAARRLHACFHGFAAPLRVVYGGIFAFWEDVDSFLDLAAARTQARGFARGSAREFVLAGAGPLKERFEKRISSERLRVNYVGSLDRKRLLELFAGAHVGIAPSIDCLTRRVACPIKVFDYASCGLPVVTPRFGEWAELVDEYECGIVTRRSNAEEFDAALDAISSEKAWKRASRNALAFAERFSWNRVLEPLAEMIENY